MTDPITTPRYTPNGPDASGQYDPGSAPNLAPSPIPPAVENKPAFTPAPVPVEAQQLAQATRSAPSTPQGGDDND
jgi:hypothetical protein